MDSEWALNPIVRRDVPVSELLSSIGGDAFPDRRRLLVDLLDIDENWHMHAVSDGYPMIRLLLIGRRASSGTIGYGFNEALDCVAPR